MELGEHIDAFSTAKLLKIDAGMAFWAMAWQKKSAVQKCLVF
jgi:hypothetical protein